MVTETWEETKERLKREKGITVKEPTPEPPKPRYEEPAPEPKEPMYNLRRVVLPGGESTWLIFNAPLQDIQWWIDHEKTRFRKKTFTSPIEGIEAIKFYEPIPVDATDDERSIYYNKKPVIVT